MPGFIRLAVCAEEGSMVYQRSCKVVCGKMRPHGMMGAEVGEGADCARP